MEEILKTFATVKRAYESRPRRPAGLLCKQGFYGGCPVLKLQKAAWTNDSMESVSNESGIFFSLWLDPHSLRQQRVLYNIHALRLRALVGYTLTSCEFARAFRQAFEPFRASWPNVETDRGPQTLMQGWIPLLASSFHPDLLRLLVRFEKISPLIDRLLAEHRTGSRKDPKLASRRRPSGDPLAGRAAAAAATKLSPF